MLVAIALDRPLADAQALVSDPQKLIEVILKIIQDKQLHPVIEGMVKADVRDEMTAAELALAPASSSIKPIRPTQKPAQQKEPADRYQ
jgi:hypothetical protein